MENNNVEMSGLDCVVLDDCETWSGEGYAIVINQDKFKKWIVEEEGVEIQEVEKYGWQEWLMEVKFKHIPIECYDEYNVDDLLHFYLNNKDRVGEDENID